MSASRSIPVSCPIAVQEVDEVLGRDVAGRARGERAAARPAERGVEDASRPPRSRRAALAKPVLRVLWKWQPTGDAERAAAPATSVSDLRRHADADRVGEDDLVRPGRGDAPARLEHARRLDRALERAAERDRERDRDAQAVRRRARPTSPADVSTASATVVFWLRRANSSVTGKA